MRILLIDFKRFFFSARMWLAVAIGCFLCVGPGLFAITQDVLNQIGIPSVGALNLLSFQFGMISLFPQFAPLVVCIPFCNAFSEDLKGNLKNVLMRTSAKKYAVSRILSSFLAGALCVLFVTLASAVIYLCVDQGISYRFMDQYYISTEGMFGEMYSQSILSFVVCSTLAQMLAGGAYSVLALGIAAITKNGLSAMTMPFIISYFSGYVMSFIPRGNFLTAVSHVFPNDVFLTNLSTYSYFFPQVAVLIVFGALLFGIGMRRWRKGAW